MTDSTSEAAYARAALSAHGSVVDTHILGAVHNGLLSVPVERPTAQSGLSSASSALSSASSALSSASSGSDDMPQLAIRHRSVV